MINACGEASNVVVQPGAELPSCRKADRSITAFLTFDCVETLEIACAFPCCREATSAKIPLPQRSDRVHRFRFVPSVYFQKTATALVISPRFGFGLAGNSWRRPTWVSSSGTIVAVFRYPVSSASSTH